MIFYTFGLNFLVFYIVTLFFLCFKCFAVVYKEYRIQQEICCRPAVC